MSVGPEFTWLLPLRLLRDTVPLRAGPLRLARSQANLTPGRYRPSGQSERPDTGSSSPIAPLSIDDWSPLPPRELRDRTGHRVAGEGERDRQARGRVADRALAGRRPARLLHGWSRRSPRGPVFPTSRRRGGRAGSAGACAKKVGRVHPLVTSGTTKGLRYARRDSSLAASAKSPTKRPCFASRVTQGRMRSRV